MLQRERRVVLVVLLVLNCLPRYCLQADTLAGMLLIIQALVVLAVVVPIAQEQALLPLLVALVVLAATRISILLVALVAHCKLTVLLEQMVVAVEVAVVLVLRE